MQNDRMWEWNDGIRIGNESELSIMVITDITQQIKNPKRYSVFVDGEFAFGMDGTDLLYHKLEIGQKLERDSYVELLKQLEYTAARDVAVKYLGRGQRSELQVRDKLHEKEFSPDARDAVIELLLQRGYLNDVEYAISFINHKTKISGHGKRRIEYELAQKGVSECDIATAYAQLEDCQGELAAARDALAKKTRNRSLAAILNDPKELNRLKGFLARRGFDFDTIDAVLKEVER